MKRVFLSFRAEDRKQVDGLRLLAANPNFDLEFFDESLRTAINSSNEAYVRSRIREKIGRTTVTVCLISELTYTSDWVCWELEESFAKGNTVIAMALKGTDRAILSKPLKERGLPFWPWDPDNLQKLISTS